MVRKSGPHAKLTGKFYKPRGDGEVGPDRMLAATAAFIPFIPPNRVFWFDLGTKKVGGGQKAPAHKREDASHS